MNVPCLMHLPLTVGNLGMLCRLNMGPCLLLDLYGMDYKISDPIFEFRSILIIFMQSGYKGFNYRKYILPAHIIITIR